MVRRILVKGAPGAGKSTLSVQLAERLGLPWIELDALHHGPHWLGASAAELRDRVLALLDEDRGWVVDGNYDSKLGTLIVDRADLIVWLDLPLRTKLVRLGRRTTRRIVRNEELWNGNRETLKGTFGGKDALFPWAVRMHFHHRRVWPARLAGKALIRLRSPGEIDSWVSNFCAKTAV